MVRFLAVLLILAMPAKAEEIVLGLSRDEVAITATFDGSDILIFGAIKREEPVPTGSELGVIVTVAGPDEHITVRRKARLFGIWVNAEAVEIDQAPTFYAVATNAPLSEILDPEEDVNTRISIRKAIQSVGAAEDGSEAFTDALIRIRAGEELYQVLEGQVDLEADTLFRTTVELPANLTEGDYATEIYLTRDGQIIDLYRTSIPVKKVGLERWLYNLAHENALLYGLMSLAIAIFSGWAASAVFTAFRR